MIRTWLGLVPAHRRPRVVAYAGRWRSCPWWRGAARAVVLAGALVGALFSASPPRGWPGVGWRRPAATAPGGWSMNACRSWVWRGRSSVRPESKSGSDSTSASRCP